jgi:HNH endonuclease
MSRRGPRYTEQQARTAIGAAHSYSEALRLLGVRPAGGNHATLKKYASAWGISTSHFEWPRVRPYHREPRPLEEVLVEGSGYARRQLKRRLIAEGLKEPRCEMCGQGDEWRGRRMALVLDHVNGVWNDNRLENLRILCPNCNATLDTHCGRKNRRPPVERACLACGTGFVARYETHRFCSRRCAVGHNAGSLRRVERPPRDRLLAEVAADGWSAVGRRYGVSDNAVRKWARAP